tara:strand:+ start:648 stop:1208 length:561 start_codon:yes stop_codon:yes gene_type:complete
MNKLKNQVSAGLAIIFKGKLLLAHATGRKRNKGYGIPKGGLDKGESPLEAAIRETREEIGIKVSKELIDTTENTFVVTSRKYRYNKTVYWYIVEIESLDQIGLKDEIVPRNQLQLEEIDWAGFLSYEKAKKITMHSQIPLINALVNKGLLEKKTNLKYIKLFEEHTKFYELRNGPKGDMGEAGKTL